MQVVIRREVITDDLAAADAESDINCVPAGGMTGIDQASASVTGFELS